MTRYWGIRFKKGPKVFITFIFQKSTHLGAGPQCCFASLSNHYSTFFGLWSKSNPFIKGHKILRHSSRKISLFSVLMIFTWKNRYQIKMREISRFLFGAYDVDQISVMKVCEKNLTSVVGDRFNVNWPRPFFQVIRILLTDL